MCFKYSNIFFIIIVICCPIFQINPDNAPVKYIELDCSNKILDSVIRRSKRNVEQEKNSEDCANFNITIRPTPDSSNHSIFLVFHPEPENSTCYDFYQVQLVKEIYASSNESEYDLLCLTNVFYNKNAVNFNNVSAGRYKTRIYPCRYDFPRKDICDAFSSDHLIISDIKAQSFEIKVDSPTKNDITIVLFSLPAIICFIIVAVILCKKSGITFSSRNLSTEIDQITLDDSGFASLSTVDILILHSHDSLVKEKALLLKDFLQNCKHFKVSSMEDELAEILVSPHDWLRSRLNYKCAHLGDDGNSNRRIIFVEPERVISSDEVFNDMEDQFYQYAICTLQSDFKKCLTDYCHLFAVQFEEAADKNEHSHSFLPGVRYTIPDNLLDLCFDLSACEEGQKKLFGQQLCTYLESHEIGKVKLKNNICD